MHLYDMHIDQCDVFCGVIENVSCQLPLLFRLFAVVTLNLSRLCISHFECTEFDIISLQPKLFKLSSGRMRQNKLLRTVSDCWIAYNTILDIYVYMVRCCCDEHAHQCIDTGYYTKGENRTVEKISSKPYEFG